MMHHAMPGVDLAFIGIGTGNPKHLTLEAVDRLNAADVILLPRKGPDKADLADLRREILARVVTAPVEVVEFDMPVRRADGDYVEGVREWHEAVAAAWVQALERSAASRAGGKLRAALMTWGDPGLYDSSLRIAERLGAGGLSVRVEVVPGITSVQALTAAHRIPLTTVGGSVLITTGRRLLEAGWPEGAETVVVMLDGGGGLAALDPAGVDIWWGAYLGMPFEALAAGPLHETARHILDLRARLRAEHGWIMDVYLLRRRG